MTIEQPTETGTATGGVTKSWSTFADWRCEIEPLSGREFFAGAALDREVNTRLSGRYIPGVTAEMRVVHGSDIYDIKVPINVRMRGRELEIMAVKE